MPLEQDLKNEIDSLEAVIIAMSFQSTSKTNAVLNVAKAHRKLLKNDLKLINSSKRTPSLEHLNFEEHAELRLESARTFLKPFIKGC
jgi:hypothetical protein